ncbi:MAG: hypothetical protein U0Q12_09240 [Vicinamibacterales bacterium]
MHRLLLASALTLFASTAFAQAPFPGAVKVGDGWVPCSHPLAIQSGLGCGQSSPGASVSDQFPWTGDTSPYATPTDSGLRFELGKMYREPYGGLVRIVGTITLTSGEMVFVGECLSGPQSSCPKDRLLRFGLTQDRGAFHWEVSAEEVPTFLP